LKNKMPLVLVGALLSLTLLGGWLLESKAAEGERAILVRIGISIDHWTADLIEEAVRDVDDGKADTLLIALDISDGYLYPSIRIAKLLSSCKGRVVGYVGPEGAAAFSYGAYVAIATHILAMNEGTFIGRGRATKNTQALGYLMETARDYAKSRGRNALATERMITENLEYSAGEAHDENICELKVKDFPALLMALGLSDRNIVEKKKDERSLDSEYGYRLLRFVAEPTTMKYLFCLLAALVLSRLTFAFSRSNNKSKTGTIHQAVLDLVKMEIQDLSIFGNHGRSEFPAAYVTKLHTPTDIRGKTTSQEKLRPPSVLRTEDREVKEN